MSKIINDFMFKYKTLAFITLFFLSACNTMVDYSSINSDLNTTNNTEYVFGTDYLPLYKDFQIIEEESTNFDTISGNIAISSYYSEEKLLKVKKFYLSIIPQLGFSLKGNIVNDSAHSLLYFRNKDKIEIYFQKSESNSSDLLVKFLISSN